MTPALIMVCDDEPRVRRLLARLLAPRYAVVEAAGGREALSLLATRRPALVLLDLHMPGLDGVAILEAARKTNSAPAVIFVTGSRDLETARRALELGARAWITKPFDVPALLSDVARILEPAERGGERPPWRVAP